MYSELGRSPGASLFLRGSAPSPCGAQVAFRLCHGKVPRPRRCSDEHFLVKPFSRVLVRGISPDPCACCASAPSQPQSLLIRGISPNPCGAQVAFRLCWRKVPRPHRSADADSLVEPFGDVLVRGLRRCLRRASPLHLLCSHLALTDFRHTCATTIATSFRLRPPPVLHDDLRCCHCRVRPRR